MKFTKEEVEQLIERIKCFNAGAVDKSMDKFIDKCWEQYLNEKQQAQSWLRRLFS